MLAGMALTEQQLPEIKPLAGLEQFQLCLVLQLPIQPAVLAAITLAQRRALTQHLILATVAAANVTAALRLEAAMAVQA